MDGQISRNLIFNVESQHEDDDDGVVDPVDDRILDDGVHGLEEEGRRGGAHHAHGVPEGHQLLGRGRGQLGDLAEGVSGRAVGHEDLAEAGQAVAEAQVAEVDESRRDLGNIKEML